MYTSMPRFQIRPHSFSVIKCRAVITTTTTVTPPAEIKAKRADPISLHSTWQHRAWVVAGSVAILSPLYKSVSLVAAAPSPVAVFEPAIAALFGYFLADLGTGFYHWGIDNYGDASTPFFGSQIEAFQVNNQENISRIFFFFFTN
jgi:palmitoyl-[glycerolipid] 3-(E)-desaturase